MGAIGLAARVGWRGLALRKGRAALMMLGVAIGIVTLTLVVSVGQGAKAKVEQGIKGFGPDAIMVAAGSPQSRGPGDERVTTLLLEDAAALREALAGVRVLVPMVTRVEQPLVAQGRNTLALVAGATPDYLEAWDWPVAAGEGLSEAHESSAARVALLGATVAQALFGQEDPVGQAVRIGDQGFKVVGVLAPRGVSPMGTDMDNRVVVPLSTAMRRLFNTTALSMLRIRMQDLDAIPGASEQIAGLLRARHHLGPADTDDFVVRSAISVRKMSAKMSGMLTTMLGIITLVSLAAGAIVLANILLASVAERRVEIGLIRALGATRKQVVQQFLVEGLVVTLLGGGIGVGVGTALAAVLGRLEVIPAQVTWEPFLLAVVASVVVGLAASYFPARRASRVEPATALRP